MKRFCKAFLAGLFVLILPGLLMAKMEASVVHDPPPPFEPDPANQYPFPTANAVPAGDSWLKLPPVDYTPPPYGRCLKGLRVCLDPGHGGYQHLKGFKSTKSGYREAIMNLTVARHLRDFLTRSGATVVLTRDLPQQKLRKGDLGTIVLVHDSNSAYEVEFVTLGGDTLAVVTLPTDAVRAATGQEIAHAREVA